MKSIFTALFALLLYSASFSQNSYVVSVCGNLGQPSPNGAFSPVTIFTYSGMSFTATPDSLGEFCVSFDAPQDSGTFAIVQYYVTYEGCGVSATETFGWYTLSSDTTFYHELAPCGIPDSSCYAYYEHYQGNTINELIFVGGCSGTAPFSYVWNFGDGSALDNNSQTSHVFADSAYYMVCLLVTDATGCESEYCNYVSIENNDSTVTNTCEVFVYYSELSDSLNNPSGNEFVFYAYPNGVPPFAYYWSFSDGSTSTSENPIHAFSFSNGWDWVCLEITDAMGCTSSYCTYVEVSNGTSAYCGTDFYGYFDDISGTPGEIFFYDYSYSSGNIIEWNWDFGDGTTSTLQNPVKIFQTADFYTVCLNTLDDAGCAGQLCQTMYIDPAWWTSSPWSPNGAACSALFLAAGDTSVDGLLYLIDLSFGNNLSYSWDFGNNVVINDQYPFVTFTSTDPIYVCLTILDTISGCTETFCETVAPGTSASAKSSNWGISVIPSPMPQSVTSVAEKSIEEGFSSSVYPNPAKDFFTFSWNANEASNLQVDLFDITGQIVMSQTGQAKEGNNQVKFSTENISSGVYFLQVKGENIHHLEKITVLK